MSEEVITSDVKDWTTGLDPEFLETIPETFKEKFKGKPADALVKSHLELESAYGKKTEGMVKIPNDKATPEEVTVYRKAIGVPESAEKYNLTIPEGDDAQGFGEIANIVKTAAFEVGISDKTLGPIWNKVVEALNAQTKAIEEKGTAMMKADEELLKNEWKENYDKFVKAGDEALSKFKIGGEAGKLLETYGIRNHPAVRKLLAEIAPFVIEGKTHLGENGEGGKQGESWFTDYKYDEKGNPVT